MPEPRGLYFIINQRQDGWWHEPDGHRRTTYATTDALPLPTEPRREPARYGQRLALRIRTLIRQTG